MGGRGCCWVSMCTAWPSHSKWLSEWSNESASNFVLSLDIPPWKLFRWFRRLQLWATGDWQLQHNNMPAHVSHLMKFFGETSNHPGDSAPYSPDLASCDFLLFPKLKSPLKGRDFRLLIRFRKIWEGSRWWLGELCKVPKCPLWRVTRHHRPIYTVSCILCLLQ